MLDTGILPYIDDVIIANSDFESHLLSIDTVLSRFRMYNLKLKPKKCTFGAERIKYLGIIVSSKGLEPHPEKISCLLNMPSPSSKKDVERLCGFVNYLSRFIPHLSDILEPIFCSKKTDPFEWNDACQKSFEYIKTFVAGDTLLRFPNFDKQFTLSTDASSVAIGAYLEQEHGPIAFASRSLNQTERNYSTTDREFLALIWGIQKFRQYLYGRSFSCRTDHKPLTSIIKASPMNTRHARYLMTLEEYDFSLEYVPGSANVVPDVLSRSVANSEKDSSEKVTACAAADSSLRFIPDDEIDDVIRQHHEYGHLGIQKTYFSLRNSRIRFNGMHSKIRKFINGCLTCAQNKSYASNCPKGSLPGFNVQPFEVVSIDLVGPLPTSINNHRYILTMIDNASRWAEAVALTNIRAETVSKTLIRCWIHRFGPPRYFLSDRGSQFLSTIYKEMAETFSFKTKYTTIYHPQGNSVIERFHRELKDRIRCIKGSWTDALQEAVWHHNRTNSTSRDSISPFQYLFGRPATIPMDWPDYMVFQPFRGRCPKKACLRNFKATALESKFFPPIDVSRRISPQLIQLTDGRVVHLKNCRVIW